LYALDSWESETFSVYVDGAAAYEKLVKYNDGWGANLCATGNADHIYDVEIEMPHDSNEIEIQFMSTLNSAEADESWSFRNF
jgi:hypothetical protein